MSVHPTIPKLSDPDLVRIALIADKLNAIKTDMEELFPEREMVIKQLILAAIAKEHVLQWGPPGTGKTTLVGHFFHCFVGAKTWTKTVSSFTPPSELFGTVDPVEWRATGLNKRQPAGTILLADFGILDEWGDLTAGVMRGELLSVMYQRTYTEYGIEKKIPLHMLVATTNRDPKDLVRRDEQKAAPLDRFVLRARVLDMQTRASLDRMVNGFQSGLESDAQMPFSELQYLSTIAANFRLMLPGIVTETYVEIMDEYDRALNTKGGNVSNRTHNSLSRMVEANALLQGRAVCDLDDLYALSAMVCDSGIPEEQKSFMDIAEPIITKAKASQVSRIDDTQLKLLAELEKEAIALPDSQVDPIYLVTHMRSMYALKAKVEDIRATTQSVVNKKTALLAKIVKIITKIDNRIKGI